MGSAAWERQRGRRGRRHRAAAAVAVAVGAGSAVRPGRSRSCRRSGAARRSGGSPGSSGPTGSRSRSCCSRSSSPACSGWSTRSCSSSSSTSPSRSRTCACSLFVALMIVVPIVSGLIGVGQSYLNNVVGQRVMQDLRNALYTHLQRCRCASSPRRAPARSRAASPTTSVASRRSSPTRRAPFANLVDRHLDRRGDDLHRLAADAAVARSVAVLHVPDLSRRQGPPRASRSRPRSRSPTSPPSPRRRSASAACC